MSYLPQPSAVVRETIVVLAGAILAAWIIGQLPGVKTWIKEQWQ